MTRKSAVSMVCRRKRNTKGRSTPFTKRWLRKYKKKTCRTLKKKTPKTPKTPIIRSRSYSRTPYDYNSRDRTFKTSYDDKTGHRYRPSSKSIGKVDLRTGLIRTRKKRRTHRFIPWNKSEHTRNTRYITNDEYEIYEL